MKTDAGRRASNTALDHATARSGATRETMIVGPRDVRYIKLVVVAGLLELALGATDSVLAVTRPTRLASRATSADARHSPSTESRMTSSAPTTSAS